MRLIGLDFETANPRAGSICAAGIAVVEDGTVTEQREWLIRPHRKLFRMARYFTAIHGITRHDVRDAPEFPEVWPLMKKLLLADGCVVIHNARFDLRQLRAVLDLYHLPPIAFPYACSLAVSRARVPGLPSYALDCVAEHFGHVFRHHDALEDAAACALIISRTGLPEDAVRRFVYTPQAE